MIQAWEWVGTVWSTLGWALGFSLFLKIQKFQTRFWIPIYVVGSQTLKNTFGFALALIETRRGLGLYFGLILVLEAVFPKLLNQTENIFYYVI